MFAFKSRTATLAFAAALFFSATLTAPPPAYAADQPDIPTVHFHTNVPLYPKFQALFRDRRPPTLIVWGKNDKIFPADGTGPYLRDLPKAEIHLLDTGHFALEDKLDVMAPMIHDFLDRSIGQGG
jgi:pimeloyl-ACP methyl ester carboxylesterase